LGNLWNFRWTFGEGAECGTRGACAPQSSAIEQIIVCRLFDAPHRRAPMLSKTIERSEFGQCAQFVFRKRHPPLEIVHRLELSIFALPHEFFGVFLPQSVRDAKSQTHCVVIDNCAAPIGLQNANRFDLQPVSLGIFHDRRRGIKAHRLIIEQTRVKFWRPMHF
jgi:hypothetical protein